MNFESVFVEDVAFAIIRWSISSHMVLLSYVLGRGNVL